MRREEIMSIVFQLGGFSTSLAIRGLSTVLEKHGLPTSGFRLYGSLIGLGAVPDHLKKTNCRHFDIVGHGFEFHFSSRPTQNLDRLGIETANERPTWDEWALEFIGESTFVMAEVVDREYHLWQNTDNPETYERAGRSHSHLPLVSNGLPYPVNEMILDISANPGRTGFQNGYFEAVGAFMWLGEPFWKLTGASKSQVQNTPWLCISHPLPSVMKLQAAEQCFTTAEGVSGELQNKLRTLLFPKRT